MENLGEIHRKRGAVHENLRIPLGAEQTQQQYNQIKSLDQGDRAVRSLATAGQLPVVGSSNLREVHVNSRSTREADVRVIDHWELAIGDLHTMKRHQEK